MKIIEKNRVIKNSHSIFKIEGNRFSGFLKINKAKKIGTMWINGKNDHFV